MFEKFGDRIVVRFRAASAKALGQQCFANFEFGTLTLLDAREYEKVQVWNPNIAGPYSGSFFVPTKGASIVVLFHTF